MQAPENNESSASVPKIMNVRLEAIITGYRSLRNVGVVDPALSQEMHVRHASCTQ